MFIKRFKKFNEDTEIDISVNNAIELEKFKDIDYTTVVESTSNKIKLDISDHNSNVKEGFRFINILEASNKSIVRVIHSALHGSNETLTELFSRKILEEDIIDFMLKLDSMTLHTLEEAIGHIDSVSKFNIWTSIHKIKNPVCEEHIKKVQALIKEQK